MWKYVLKRLLLLIPVMLGTILVVFFIMDQSDVDPAKVMLGDAATEETIAQLHEELGLDDPFLVRYARYVLNLIKGDMGTSYNYHTPVANQIAARLPNTILLAGTAVLLTIIVGIPIGVLAAKKQYSFFDNISMVFCLFGAASPAFWIGLILVLVFSLELPILPASGMGKGFINCLLSLILPAITLSLHGTATAARTTRSSMLDTIRQDYIDTARAKGTSEKVITRKHKLDVNILLRDLRINAKAVCLITNSGALPVNLIEFIDKVEKCLISIQKETPDGFGMQDVLASIGNVKSACTILVECIKDNPSTDYDAFLKSVAGELVRLVYSAGSMYQQDLSSPYQPFGIIASSVKTAKNMHGTVLALCAKTEFIRACNRIKGQCDAIQKMIKCYMTMA